MSDAPFVEIAVGRRVRLVGSHPHAGKEGVVTGYSAPINGRRGAAVLFDDGRSAFVFSGWQVEEIIVGTDGHSNS
jgi:hypothetical protein